MDSRENRINKLEGVLFKYHPQLVDKLLPGLTLIGGDPILPDAVQKLYEWHNGTLTDNIRLGQTWLFPLGAFLSIEEVRGIREQMPKVDPKWKDSFFPVFGSGGGDYFLIDLEDNNTPDQFIYYFTYFNVSFDTIVTFFDSINSAIDTIIECYGSGAFTIKLNSEGEEEFEFDEARYRIIAASLNPRSQYWKIS